MTHAEAKYQGLDPVFPEVEEIGQRIFYDAREGCYYDTATDLYLADDFNPLNAPRY